eukprot:jgi/Bigna1/132855/aug1.19_g7563
MMGDANLRVMPIYLKKREEEDCERRVRVRIFTGRSRIYQTSVIPEILPGIMEKNPSLFFSGSLWRDTDYEISPGESITVMAAPLQTFGNGEENGG